MVTTMNDWNGREIRIAKSRLGKISVCNYRDNLIVPHNSVFPHPDIVKKLYKSNHSKDFDGSARSEVSKELGFYCDLQSLRSEDAITWSVFGTLHYFPKQTQIGFVNSLLELIGERLKVKDCEIQLWSRVAHPDTLVSGGPELDFQIVTDKMVIFGESKWTSKLSKDQGVGRNKDQLQLRREYMQKYGKAIFRKVQRLLVLVVGLVEQESLTCPFTTWKQVCDNAQHPMKEEVRKYYRWKEKHGR